ncbi:NAD dependent epimerase/dehydratase family [Gloeomargarita lithophora Alchichica-D10]|uniref:NAD dependent epimerase/dehydratase family n=1 Tax=Gloeomargarita lithophora Alchichica-D10 TaxID=1188229 RepID=A0A1J0A968_9CYAN|nr:NAD-dependent epimerase [Gloeomargarita lithophora]APB32463.1 NAD dependent epimerase/dehydratase family [Gloeomargarita lithophora Alchichica-D10]
MTGRVLVTGAAGFIGFHFAQALLAQGVAVVGVDNLNPYYEVQLKRDRLHQLKNYQNFIFLPLDVADKAGMEQLFQQHQPETVVHLAAQAGVRYSLEHPHTYVESNLVGFLHILEGCRQYGVKHLVFASSSSVYGLNRKMPFSVGDNVDHPISLYAATKKSNELMAHTYSYLFNLPVTGLRFFTVYGPWGRPDMALFKFTKAILEQRPIQVYNHGKMQRDFTYIDDIVAGMLGVLGQIPTPNDAVNLHPGVSVAPYRLYNIGNHRPVALMDFIAVLEQALGQTAMKEFLPMQPGDVPATYADIADLTEAVGFLPQTPIEVGIPQFVAWYRDYYHIS